MSNLGDLNGLPVSIIIRTTLQDLESRAGVGTTGGGTVLPIADVIRMAGHANHYLAVFDGVTGQALDLFRTRRTASPAQRIMLAARDGGCTKPGCTVGIYGCQVHHATADWAHGGNTNVNDMALACPPDNRSVGPHGYTTCMNDRHEAEWIPPHDLDTGQARDQLLPPPRSPTPPTRRRPTTPTRQHHRPAAHRRHRRCPRAVRPTRPRHPRRPVRRGPIRRRRSATPHRRHHRHRRCARAVRPTRPRHPSTTGANRTSRTSRTTTSDVLDVPHDDPSDEHDPSCPRDDATAETAPAQPLWEHNGTAAALLAGCDANSADDPATVRTVAASRGRRTPIRRTRPERGQRSPARRPRATRQR